jgi:hypothetical protein
MPHFEGLLALFKEFLESQSQHDPPSTCDWKCEDRMVLSVITFADVFLDGGRYEDAVCVLDSTHNHYEGTKFQPHLTRRLSKAISLPP